MLVPCARSQESNANPIQDPEAHFLDMSAVLVTCAGPKGNSNCSIAKPVARVESISYAMQNINISGLGGSQSRQLQIWYSTRPIKKPYAKEGKKTKKKKKANKHGRHLFYIIH